VATAAAFLTSRGAKVTNPHPIDLLFTEPYSIIFEAKVVSGLGALLAVRAAVGQLFEYRRFIGPRQAKLCILLDQEPAKELVNYVEGDLGLLIAWLSAGGMEAGPTTADQLPLR
jgi:hypothetical protein